MSVVKFATIEKDLVLRVEGDQFSLLRNGESIFDWKTDTLSYEKFVDSMLLGDCNRKRFALAMAEELGELCGKLTRLDRGDYDTDAQYIAFAQAERLELGDILFYLTAYANFIGTDLNTVMNLNRQKLLDRRARQALKGEGDNR